MEPGPVPDFSLSARHVYDAEIVDRYTAKLQGELADLRARLAAVEGGHRPTTEGIEGLLGRTLLNAQRTADQAIAEAEERAEGITADARRAAEQTVADAYRQAQSIIEDAERKASGILERDATRVTVPDREAEAQRIIDDAHRRIDAIFAAARRRTSEEHPAHPTPFAPHPAPFAPPEPDTKASGDDATGRILELRPDPLGPERTFGRTSPTDRCGLRATGTDDLVRPTVLIGARPVPVQEDVEEGKPTNRLFLNDWRERWHVARGGSAFVEGALSRDDHIASLTDFASELRDPTARPVHPPSPRHARRTGFLALLFRR